MIFKMNDFSLTFYIVYAAYAIIQSILMCRYVVFSKGDPKNNATQFFIGGLIIAPLISIALFVVGIEWFIKFLIIRK